MSAEERKARSRLRQLVLEDGGLLRGTLVERRRACGKPNCRCAQGEGHPQHVLVARYEGKLRQLHIPKALVPVVREWIAEYQRLREMLEDLSRVHWDKIKRRDV